MELKLEERESKLLIKKAEKGAEVKPQTALALQTPRESPWRQTFGAELWQK